MATVDKGEVLFPTEEELRGLHDRWLEAKKQSGDPRYLFVSISPQRERERKVDDYIDIGPLETYCKRCEGATEDPKP